MFSNIISKISAIMLTFLAIVTPFWVSANETALTLEQRAVTIATNEIQLHSYDGSMSMKGELLAYNHGRYQLETALGALLISASLVWCDGAACPPPATVLSDIQALGDVMFDQNSVLAGSSTD